MGNLFLKKKKKLQKPHGGAPGHWCVFEIRVVLVAGVSPSVGQLCHRGECVLRAVGWKLPCSRRVFWGLGAVCLEHEVLHRCGVVA